MASYCQYIQQLKEGEQILHQQYHHFHYGFPIADDDALFGRLILEINQAGLSWTTILNKQEHFFRAYDGFSIAKIADYKEEERQRLLNDSGIIRNRLKIDAAIHNAGVVAELQAQFGSFKNWLNMQHPLTKEEWVKVFKKHFRFTGGEIVNEFLMSTGYLPGAHEINCPVYAKILAANPPWLMATG